tara:strand:- start:6 stop:218 length:213 start_codon:yes stop_codon:yes gene_type:complete
MFLSYLHVKNVQHIYDTLSFQKKIEMIIVKYELLNTFVPTIKLSNIQTINNNNGDEDVHELEDQCIQGVF